MILIWINNYFKLIKISIFDKNVNKLDNFIQGWYLEDTSICDRLIDFHKNSKDKHEGVIGGGGVNKSIKDSIDAIVTYDVAVDYFKYLHMIYSLFELMLLELVYI